MISNMGDSRPYMRTVAGTAVGWDGNAWHIPANYSMVEDAVLRHHPAALALVDGTDHVTFGTLAEEASRIAGGLLKAGIARGDRVGVALPQGRSAAASHLAVLWAGAISMPLSTRESVESRGEKLLKADAVAVIAEFDTGPFPCEHIHTGDGGKSSLDCLRRSEPVKPVQTSGDDPAVLLFTSGTTGRPRGALLPHRVLLARVPGFQLAQDEAPKRGDRFWTPVEWTWVGSFLDSVFTPWVLGIPVVAQLPGPFDPERAVATIDANEVRNAFLPPTALRLMSVAGVQSRHPLRALHSGGESLTSSAVRWASEALGAVPNEIYGQSEASFLAGSGGRYGRRANRLGRAYPGHKLILLDDDERPVPPGEIGEICVVGDDPVVFLGYWGEAAAGGQWWHTGDLATADEDGFLGFVARKDDLIISAGYRVDPAQVEEALMSHPAVRLAAVVGTEDELRGQVPVAYVTLLDREADDWEALRTDLYDAIKAKIPGYARPREIVPLPELPLTNTGKIARVRLSKQPMS